MNNDDILSLLKRDSELFQEDLKKFEESISREVSNSSFLVIGGAGSIGNATVKELFKRNPRVLHVVDINENALVELVRDIRSSMGYIEGDFRTLCIDSGSYIFEKFFNDFGNYDYILNFSALKHVRSEEDPYTLMRMIEVNILNTIKTLELAIQKGVKKYFCISTDKATNPVNMMGASKRIMELFLMRYSDQIKISTARFANVAFSNGSLLDGFKHRIEKRQPLSAPVDVKRYFLTPRESGVLCLLSAILGKNKELLFPKLNNNLHLLTFSELAERYLKMLGYEPYICKTEEEARAFFKQKPVSENQTLKYWPVYFFISDTTGEKEAEEFYDKDEIIDWNRFVDIGVAKMKLSVKHEKFDFFLKSIEDFKRYGWTKSDLVKLFKYMVKDFSHKETGKYLSQRM